MCHYSLARTRCAPSCSRVVLSPVPGLWATLCAVYGMARTLSGLVLGTPTSSSSSPLFYRDMLLYLTSHRWWTDYKRAHCLYAAGALVPVLAAL